MRSQDNAYRELEARSQERQVDLTSKLRHAEQMMEALQRHVRVPPLLPLRYRALLNPASSATFLALVARRALQVAVLEKGKQEALDDARAAIQREARAIESAEASAQQIEQLEAQVTSSVPLLLSP